MKEKIYTIPLMDAFKADDECPFCFIERNLEQHAIDFVLGSGAEKGRNRYSCHRITHLQRINASEL